jgi:hypothetical protein
VPGAGAFSMSSPEPTLKRAIPELISFSSLCISSCGMVGGKGRTVEAQ